MMKSSVPPNAPVALPPLVAAYVEATNSFDLERLLATFPRTLSSMISYGTTGESPPSESGRSANEVAAQKKGLDVRTSPTSATIESDALLLGTVLRNLVSNAVKYTQPGGRILLGCRHTG